MERKRNRSYSWLAMFSMFTQVICLKDLHVSIPEAVAAGDRVTLSCFYDLENAALYSVRWYFENQEFYRYVPIERPPTRVFKVSDIPVDVQKSTEHRVVLRTVTTNHSGSYTCEVSEDAPLFHTESSSGTMLVVNLPKSEPIITIVGMPGVENKRFVNRQDTFKAQCTLGPSYPSVNFTWFVNDIKVPATQYDLHSLDPFSATAISRTESRSEILIPVDHYIMTPSDRKLVVTCETSIFSLYRCVAQMEIYIMWDPRDTFWLNEGKASATRDQRRNRGDPDNSALTGSSSSYHRTLINFGSKTVLIDIVQYLGSILLWGIFVGVL